MSEKQYAVIKEGNITNILIFDNPSQDLINNFVNMYNADQIILCNELAQVGGTYDDVKFWPPQPYPSWLKDEDENEWYPPIPMPIPPDDRHVHYQWNEDILDWEEIQVSE